MCRNTFRTTSILKTRCKHLHHNQPYNSLNTINSNNILVTKTTSNHKLVTKTTSNNMLVTRTTNNTSTVTNSSSRLVTKTTTNNKPPQKLQQKKPSNQPTITMATTNPKHP